MSLKVGVTWSSLPIVSPDIPLGCWNLVAVWSLETAEALGKVYCFQLEKLTATFVWGVLGFFVLEGG